MATKRAATAAYDAQKHLLLVVGGNGFVGSNILQRAVQKGIEVRSLNKSGKPTWQDVPWIDQVDWQQGDVFNPEDLAKAVDGVTGVITTVGAFGDNALMEKMCGDANILAAQAAKKAGVDRFVFISNSRVGSYLPSWVPLYGYYHGKERAEAATRECFPTSGVCLRPGFIYGLRRTKSYPVPLQLVGSPMSMVARSLGPVSSIVTKIPFVGHEIQSAIPVGDVAKAAVLSAMGQVPKNIFDTSDMMALAASFHHTFHED